MFDLRFKYIAIVVALIFSVFSEINAETKNAETKYAIGKIYLKDGRIVDGKQMVVSVEQISMVSHYKTLSFPLSDVSKAEAKKGWAGGWAAGCGLGCFTALLVANLANPENTMTGGQIVVGCAIWGVASTGVGALIGHLSDKYKLVFSGSNQSFLDTFDFNIAYHSNESIGANLSFPIMPLK